MKGPASTQLWSPKTIIHNMSLRSDLWPMLTRKQSLVKGCYQPWTKSVPGTTLIIKIVTCQAQENVTAPPKLTSNQVSNISLLQHSTDLGFFSKQFPFKAFTLNLSGQHSVTKMIFYNTIGRVLHILLTLNLLV